jgi:AcrR family transcriptional regulator
MREWIPISTSPKGRLALAAVEQFGTRAFDDVTVGELAAAADVTTGAIYHHFGSKLGLYDFVREDVERRVLDRMAGAIAATVSADASRAVQTALLVGFDFAVDQGLLYLMAAPPAGAERDRLAELLGTATSPILGRLLGAAWRAALAAVADGSESGSVRAALLRLDVSA